MSIGTSIQRRTGSGGRSRGVASLAVTLIMLALAALVILYTNRGQLFEQRTSANQARATVAFEAAEAGIEWGLARLNDETLIQPSPTSTCGYAAGGQPFTSFYTPSTADPNNPTVFTFNPPNGARAACSIDEATGQVLTCRCPVPLGSVTIAAPGRRSFEVSYSRVVADPGMVEIRSVGCRDAVDGSGNPVVCSAAGAFTTDGIATITVRAKYVPAAGSISNAALTTGGYAAVCGSYNITNGSGAAGGVLVNSGGNTNIGNGTYTSGPLPPGAPNCGGGGGQTLTTIPGTPISAAVIPNDPALLAASATADSMMFAYFGMTIAQYQAPPTCTINGTSAGDRETNLLAAYNRTSNPCSRFWINGGDIQFSGNGTLGSATRPVMIASADDMTFNGNYTVYGILYGDNVTFNYNGTGTADIIGQIVVRGGFYSNGNGSIVYNDTVLRAYTGGSGEFIRVPGSWRDS
jgi:hypothetical protein